MRNKTSILNAALTAEDRLNRQRAVINVRTQTAMLAKIPHNTPEKFKDGRLYFRT